MGIGENQAQAFEDFRAAEVGEEDAVVLGIREALVTSAGAGELGIEVDGVAHIADDEERRATVASRNGSDVIAALVIGAFQGFVEGRAAPAAMAGFGGGRWPGLIRADTLFGFQHEVGGFVEIDVIRDRRAIRIHAGHGAVEYVSVLFRIGRSGIGPWDFEEIA